MSVAEITIAPFHFETASDEQCLPLWQCYLRARAERAPDDPLFPFADYLAVNRNLPAFFKEMTGVVREGQNGPMLGYAVVEVNTSGDFANVAFVDLFVLPEVRRQGHGRRLLAMAAELARAEGRELMLFFTHNRAPGGAAFAERIGARRGLEERISQLNLAEVDRELMRSWRERAAERAAGFALGFWDAAYPEEDLAAIAELIQVMNTAPRDALEISDETWNPEKLREHERSLFNSNLRRLTVYARERASGAFAGFSEIFWRPSMPALIHQGGTGVYPRFRGLGLGRWLKAAMIERVLDEMPEARVVRTGNAESNAPMLKINVEMGFKPYLASCIWQLETERVLAYLGAA